MASPQLGAGFCGIGVSAAGFGLPASPDGPAGVVVRNADDQRTLAVQLTGRKIDAVTKQYVFGADGNIVGQNTVSQLAQIAWSTVKGSCADRTIGHELRTLDVIGADHERRVANLLTAAVQPYIDQKLMQILSITVTRFNPQGTLAQVRWLDLTTGIEDTAKV